MKEKKSEITIPLDFIEPKLELHIYGNKKDTLFEIDNQVALENGESPFQILEGYFYNYYFKQAEKTKLHYQLRENNVVKNTLRKEVSEGRISPNIYVGSLTLTVFNIETKEEFKGIDIEVIATKLDDNNVANEDPNYRKNYQFMLKDIAEKCTELLMQINSPVTQNFEINFNKDNQTIYQRFSFVNALINTNEFNEAVQRIISSPTTKWLEEIELKDTRSVRRLSSSSIRQIASRSNRVKLSNPIGKLNDIPTKIQSSHKVETTDTHENRFVKHALEVFLQFCMECRNSFIINGYTKSKIEVEALIEKLDNNLNQPFFKEIERPTTLKLNSPALQRKSGYRELLNAWLQYDLAAKLVWKGGDDVYKAGKRDIAVLYEYWLFFVLYDLIKSKFDFDKGNNSYGHLIEPTQDGLNVMVKSGKLTALEGTYKSDGRELHIKFSYNRTFEGGSIYNKQNKNKSFSGSWTKPLRPDYTLSIWPEEIKDEEIAEVKEKIVHIHFDSKYKVQQFTIKTDVEENLTETEEDSTDVIIKNEKKIDSLEKEKIEERKGIYKNADLLKMHAYKDAIRRTGGAYVLYPGNNNDKSSFQGFHELIPGLGAFAIRPKEGKNGTIELSDFIDEIIDHFKNMASQQRRHSNKIYEIHRNHQTKVNDPMPEYIIPDETNVIIAYYKSEEHLEWIKTRMKYNGRIGNSKGAMDLTPEFIGAKYLILHNKKNPNLIIYEINQLDKKKPLVVSKEHKMFEDYPKASKPFYLIFNLIEKPKDFLNGNYNIKKLNGYSEDKEAFPFTCKLTEFFTRTN
jgi:predicted component of viral defense system (DUF524 family)